MISSFPAHFARSRGLRVSTQAVDQDVTWVIFDSEWSGPGSHGVATPTSTKVLMPALFQLSAAHTIRNGNFEAAKKRALKELDKFHRLPAGSAGHNASEANPKVYDAFQEQDCIVITIERDE